jgi:hypothetical protein
VKTAKSTFLLSYIYVQILQKAHQIKNHSATSSSSSPCGFLGSSTVVDTAPRFSHGALKTLNPRNPKNPETLNPNPKNPET